MRDTDKDPCESMRDLLNMSREDAEHLDSIARPIFKEGATICQICEATVKAALAEPDRRIALALMYALALFKADQDQPGLIKVIMERIR